MVSNFIEMLYWYCRQNFNWRLIFRCLPHLVDCTTQRRHTSNYLDRCPFAIDTTTRYGRLTSKGFLRVINHQHLYIAHNCIYGDCRALYTTAFAALCENWTVHLLSEHVLSDDIHCLIQSQLQLFAACYNPTKLPKSILQHVPLLIIILLSL